MFGLSISEVLVILVVALVIFGPERLPEVSRTVGKTVGSLRRTLDELKYSFSLASLEEVPQKRATPHGLTATEPRAAAPSPVPASPTPELTEEIKNRAGEPHDGTS
jgi:Tat protein translocase TatB subunit